MVIAMILRGNRIEIAAYKSHLASSFVKRISLEVGDSLIKNGKILSSHFLGKLIGAELKKNRLSPGELIIAVRSNEILIEKIYIANHDKNSAFQRANEVLEASQPGILDNNDIICKKYNEQDGRMCLNIAIVPKLLIEQHRTLAKAMKCRLGKLISYVDCVAKLAVKDHVKLSDEQRLVDIGEDFIQLYHFEDGEIQSIDEFSTQQTLRHSSSKITRTELLKQFREEGNAQYVFLQELFQDLDRSLLDVLILEYKKQDNLLTVSGRQKGSIKRVNIRHAMFLTAAGAFSVFLIIIFFALGSSSTAGQKTSVNVDYRMIQDIMEEIMDQGQSHLNYVSLDSDWSVKVEAATSAYSNINTVIGKMDEAGLDEVELVQVRLVSEQDPPILYTISAKYVVKADQSDAVEK